MANLLYQQIEMLSREKHIEPDVVISAIEDAMVVAARKFYKSEEDLRGKFNAETGQVDVYSVITVVEEVADLKDRRNPTGQIEIGPADELTVAGLGCRLNAVGRPDSGEASIDLARHRLGFAGLFGSGADLAEHCFGGS